MARRTSDRARGSHCSCSSTRTARAGRAVRPAGRRPRTRTTRALTPAARGRSGAHTPRSSRARPSTHGAARAPAGRRRSGGTASDGPSVSRAPHIACSGGVKLPQPRYSPQAPGAAERWPDGCVRAERDHRADLTPALDAPYSLPRRSTTSGEGQGRGACARHGRLPSGRAARHALGSAPLPDVVERRRERGARVDVRAARGYRSARHVRSAREGRGQRPSFAAYVFSRRQFSARCLCSLAAAATASPAPRMDTLPELSSWRAASDKSRIGRKSARLVIAAIEAHTGEMSTRLSARTREYEHKGEKTPDVGLLVRLLGRELAAVLAALSAADRAHEAELGDDAGPRAQRDEAAQQLRAGGEHPRPRRGLLRARDPGAPRSGHARAAGSRRAQELRRDGGRGPARRRRGPAAALATRRGLRIDRKALAEDLAAHVPTLATALDAVAREKREADADAGRQERRDGALRPGLQHHGRDALRAVPRRGDDRTGGQSPSVDPSSGRGRAARCPRSVESADGAVTDLTAPGHPPTNAPFRGRIAKIGREGASEGDSRYWPRKAGLHRRLSFGHGRPVSAGRRVISPGRALSTAGSRYLHECGGSWGGPTGVIRAGCAPRRPHPRTRTGTFAFPSPSVALPTGCTQCGLKRRREPQGWPGAVVVVMVDVRSRRGARPYPARGASRRRSTPPRPRPASQGPARRARRRAPAGVPVDHDHDHGHAPNRTRRASRGGARSGPRANNPVRSVPVPVRRARVRTPRVPRRACTGIARTSHVARRTTTTTTTATGSPARPPRGPVGSGPCPCPCDVRAFEPPVCRGARAPGSRARRTSHVARRTSHVARRTSHVARRTSHDHDHAAVRCANAAVLVALQPALRIPWAARRRTRGRE